MSTSSDRWMIRSRSFGSHPYIGSSPCPQGSSEIGSCPHCRKMALLDQRNLLQKTLGVIMFATGCWTTLVNCNCNYILLTKLPWFRKERRVLPVFESSCHLPTCLPHTVEAAHCFFIADRQAGKL